MNMLIGARPCLAALALVATLPSAVADDHTIRADDHAPIGVMGDHLHERGEWMVSYRYMHMAMDGNRLGSDDINPDTIVTTIPNRFFGRPMQPPTLRVVPTSMDMDMHMVGVMYGLTDTVTLMAMLNFIDLSMDHLTYQGGMGTTVLGTFTTESSGLGDTPVTALIRQFDNGRDRGHWTLGLSLPTGSTDETDAILTPMNMRPTVRLPYPMQLGSGSFEAIAGFTWVRSLDWGSLGAQWRSELPLETNDEGYQWGDQHGITAWASRLFGNSLSASLRAGYRYQGDIDGIDPVIVAPVQTADPDRLGGETFELGAGINWAATGDWAGNRLALEVMVPVWQDLNGPQLETDWSVTAGWQFAF